MSPVDRYQQSFTETSEKAVRLATEAFWRAALEAPGVDLCTLVSAAEEAKVWAIVGGVTLASLFEGWAGERAKAPAPPKRTRQPISLDQLAAVLNVLIEASTELAAGEIASRAGITSRRAYAVLRMLLRGNKVSVRGRGRAMRWAANKAG